MQILLWGLLISVSAFGRAAETAKCVAADTVKEWEARYCLQLSGAGDTEAEAFLECRRKYLKDTSVPKAKCARIRWLKSRTCVDDAMNGHTKAECLGDPKFLKNSADDAPRP